MVRFKDVHKRFGRLEVLRGVNAAFEAGKTTVVIGPSGTGKSVLLKHIAGLQKPDSGEVWFKDQRIDGLRELELAPIRRQIGFLFQSSALFDSMTIGDNLAFPLIEHTGLDPRERAKRVEEALQTVDLAGVENKLPSQLSGGQQKRAALARASIYRPALMLYDEPTTGLDPIRADGICQLIVKLRDQMGVTGIVVTHDLEATKKIADRVLMLYEGKFIADGSLDELRNSKDPHVSHFLAGEYEPDPLETAGGPHQ
ncbi:MAG TPA: ABC transporter ATP-binding protein [Phycisphaerales bacterium]|nr:ABC transporter ATP-binding protein [Phycisphaerales bacterium]